MIIFSAPGDSTAAAAAAAINCTETAQVLACLTWDTESVSTAGGRVGCDGLTRELLNVTRASGSPLRTFSHYVGVARHAVVTEYMAFFRAWLETGDAGRNVTSWYHNALPTGVEWDGENGEYIVADTLPDPLWVETRWGDGLGIRVFLEDSPVSQTVVVIMGVLVTAGTYCFAIFARRHWIMTFKAD
jgi:hypothetical protein